MTSIGGRCWVVLVGLVVIACGATPQNGANGGSDGGTVTTSGTTGGDGTGSSPSPPDSGVTLTPPITKDGWTFYGTSQGLSQQVEDVSADEGGNVYVAGHDALYVKTRSDQRFLRFDASNGGLTQNCYGVVAETDPSFSDAINGKLHPSPPGAPITCPIISVAGTAAGGAAVGFKGLGTDGDPDADWAQDSGGMDLVAFDGKALSRVRHVFVASPPHTICGPYDGHPFENRTTSCGNPYEYFWTVGRRKLRQVNRIAVNHNTASPMYGDIWMGGTHATVAALLKNAGARGYPDRTAGLTDPWPDAKDVWEHDHPAWYDAASGLFLTNTTYAIAIDPRSGQPWGSNGFRTATVTGYGADLHDDNWWMPTDSAHPLWLDVWTDAGTPSAPIDPLGAANDHLESLSFCNDGTLWMGSSTHGLARRDPSGAISYVAIPDLGEPHGNNAYAVACDPSDGSVWIGLGWGGVMRYRNGSFTLLDPNAGFPAVARQPVRSIQIDRWASPRIVYFAFMASGTATGGVASYNGP